MDKSKYIFKYLNDKLSIHTDIKRQNNIFYLFKNEEFFCIEYNTGSRILCIEKDFYEKINIYFSLTVDEFTVNVTKWVEEKTSQKIWKVYFISMMLKRNHL